jgi:CRP/FNR family transcriptional regulator
MSTKSFSNINGPPMNITSEIQKLPLFRGLPDAQIAEMAAIAIDRTLPKNAVIFSEGTECDGFYAVTEGQIRVYKLAQDGKEQTLHIFGPGEIFGEVPVFMGGHFPAHACTLKKTQLLFFPRQAFIDLIYKDPSLALKMLAVLCQRLHRFTTMVENLSLKEVPGRLAAYLLYLADQSDTPDKASLDTSKVHLASLLGTIPETLSRILGKMTQQGFIRATDNRTIQLLDKEGLERLSQGDRLEN